MKGKTILSCILGGLFSLSASACTLGKSTLLAKPIPVQALSYQETLDEALIAFEGKVNEFSGKFSQSALERFDMKNNFTLSPISVFFALALASECATGDTRAELLSALDVSYEQLTTNISKLYRMLEKTYTKETALGKEKVIGQLSLSNSIWIDEQVKSKKACLDALSSNYYCYTYQANFLSDNTSANQAVRNFVKKQTKNKIDRNFQLSKETLFALINTLYLKDVWNVNGKELSKSSPYQFTNTDGTTVSKNLLTGYYKEGRAYKAECYSYFYTTTYHGYKIKFILPNEGYTVKDVFTAQTLNEINEIQNFNSVDEEKRIKYYTRCLFPAYKAEFYQNVNQTLQEDFDITSLFSSESCDFSNLSEWEVYCDKVIHSAKLDVTAKGIEGAAVTVVGMGTSAGPPPYTIVHEDFVVDKAFAFLLTSPENVTLFSGIINKI